LKAIIAIVVLITVSIGIFIGAQDTKKEICIEDWYAQTSQLFQSASGFFSREGAASDDDNALDAKLQALLPSDNIDLRYHNSEPAFESNDLSLAPTQDLLPNLFNPATDPSTKINGQVFRDEDDKIVGAELNVSIPADIR
jgi:hypothetical protein